LKKGLGFFKKGLMKFEKGLYFFDVALGDFVCGGRWLCVTPSCFSDYAARLVGGMAVDVIMCARAIYIENGGYWRYLYLN
jgi:hypothetical protein